MKESKKITLKFKALEKLYNQYEGKRQELTRDIMETAKNLPMSESEICRRVGISRSAWGGYKETGLPFEKFSQIINFFLGLRIDNKPVIL